MSQQLIQDAISNKKMKCPSCAQPVQKAEKIVDMTASVWDGAGDSGLETAGTKATLVCGNCDWKERTEYWANYIEE